MVRQNQDGFFNQAMAATYERCKDVRGMLHKLHLVATPLLTKSRHGYKEYDDSSDTWPPRSCRRLKSLRCDCASIGGSFPREHYVLGECLARVFAPRLAGRLWRVAGLDTKDTSAKDSPQVKQAEQLLAKWLADAEPSITALWNDMQKAKVAAVN